MSDSSANRGWIKLVRSDETRELLTRDPLAFLLLAHAAIRARWKNGYNVDGLVVGEALVGDHKAMGMTRQQYRTRLQRLDTWKFATNRATNKGTVISITSTAIFDVFGSTNNQPGNQPATNGQPSDNHQITTNEEGKKDKTEKKHRSPTAQGAKFSSSTIDEIYQVYPRKKAPSEAKKAIAKHLSLIAGRGTPNPAAWLLDQVKAFAKTRIGEDERFTPYPATWFNAGSYDEDFATSAASGNGVNGHGLPAPIKRLPSSRDLYPVTK